jgi:hypothetical protein
MRRRSRRSHWRSPNESTHSSPSKREINGLSAAKRVAARQERSAPLVAAFEAWMRAERAKLARLEAVNKQLGTRICVSAAAAERAQGFVGRPVGDLLLRGRNEPMRVFELLSQDERASRHTLAYAAAFSKLEATILPRWPPSPH